MTKTVSNSTHEVDLSRLISIIKKHIYVLLFFTTSITSLATIYVYQLPDTYESKAILIPHSIESSSYNLNLGSKLDGLTSLIGANRLGDGDNKIILIKELMKSVSFAHSFSEEHDLLPLFFAANGIDPKTNKIIFDENIYDHNKKTWTRQVSPPLTAKPNKDEVYEKYIESVNVSIDEESGYITITVRTVSPTESKKIIEKLVSEITKRVSKRERELTSKLIQQLEIELNKTTSTNIKLLLTNILEQQLHRHAIANLDDYFTFSYLDEPYEATFPSGPPRLQIIIATILSSFLALLATLVLKQAYWTR